MADKPSLYKRSIKKQLYFANSLSCAELSDLTGKSLPLTTKILNELIKENEVIETGQAASTGGRRPQMYSLKPDLMYVLAVSIDQLITRMVFVDMQNNFLGKPVKLELPLSNNDSALNDLTEHIKEYILSSGISKEKIVGIGIGMPGFIDVKKGINHSFFKTEDVSIVSFIESETGLPVLIDNDSSLIALAESRQGIARDKQNVMVINIGWGVGLGMILNGKLFRGENGFAGEFSHIPLFTNNKICSCGKMGCLETETSLLVIMQKAIDGLVQGKLSSLNNLAAGNIEKSSNQIMNAAIAGDKFAIELVSEAGYNIGRGVAILVHLLNPEIVVLSGRGSVGGKLWITPIQQAINEHCIPKIAENLTIKISTLGYQAELFGAAALVMENYEIIDFEKKRIPGNKKLLVD